MVIKLRFYCILDRLDSTQKIILWIVFLSLTVLNRLLFLNCLLLLKNFSHSQAPGNWWKKLKCFSHNYCTNLDILSVLPFFVHQNLSDSSFCILDSHFVCLMVQWVCVKVNVLNYPLGLPSKSFQNFNLAMFRKQYSKHSIITSYDILIIVLLIYQDALKLTHCFLMLVNL